MKTYISGLLALLLCIVQTAGAYGSIQLHVGDRIRFTDKEGTVGAGEYGVHLKNSASPAGGDSQSAELFRTFCIEKTEYLDFDSKGFVIDTIEKYAVAGAGGAVNGRDPISAQTAWLFYKFSTNTLAGYAHTDALANKLQNALWFFEDEGGVQNIFTVAANNAVSSTNAAVMAEVAYAVANVHVLNIKWATDRHGFDGVYEYDSRSRSWSAPGPGANGQSVLYFQHMPEPGAVCVWIVLGACGLGVYSRKTT